MAVNDLKFGKGEALIFFLTQASCKTSLRIAYFFEFSTQKERTLHAAGRWWGCLQIKLRHLEVIECNSIDCLDLKRLLNEASVFSEKET